MARRTLYGTVIVTYRCNARCNMCDCFKDPTRPDEEITLEDIKKLPEIPFIFAGTGPLEEQVNQAVNVENRGFVTGDALHKLIAEARFSVYPSEWYENCPFSIMESQMYGTPVLASDLGGAPELVQAGKTGELFRGGDVEELTEHIRDLWNQTELCRKYSENCKDINFDTVETYCGKMVEIYRQK